MTDLILVRFQLNREDQNETLVEYLNYKIYKRKEWKLILMLNTYESFGYESCLEFKDIKDSFEVITDKSKIQGFIAVFGNELPNKGGKDIFWEMERDHKDDIKRFSQDVAKLEQYVERANELFWLFRDVMQYLLNNSMFSKEAVEIEEGKDILKEIPDGCDICVETEEECIIGDVYSLVFELYRTKVETEHYERERRRKAREFGYEEKEKKKEKQILPNQISEFSYPKEGTQIDYAEHISGNLLDIVCLNFNEISIENIDKLLIDLNNTEKNTIQYINELRFMIFEKDLAKYLAAPLVRIIKRF
jgi:hypothetical protein